MNTQAIRVAFKDLPVTEQENVLRQLVHEHVYMRALQGFPMLTTSQICGLSASDSDDANARANAAEGERDRLRGSLSCIIDEAQKALAK